MKVTTKHEKRQRGFTLLEYCMGAAVLLGIVFAGLSLFGAGLNDYFGNIGQWLQSRQIPN